MAKNRRKFKECPNCGYIFEEANNYCPQCGQENHDLNVPVKHLIAEFFEGTMHFDTKAWHTLKYLITKPGYLTECFNLGKRASYVPPFRLYVFVSLVFFFVLALTSESSIVIQKNEGDPIALAGVSPDDSVRLEKAKALAKDANQFEKANLSFGKGEAATKFTQKFKKFTSNGDNSKQRLFKNLSFMMFLLMPFFAFVLYLYYIRQNRNYVEHLMFSIHLHTFYFLLLTAAMLLGAMVPSLELEWVVFAIIVLYLYLALHRVYKQSYKRTLLSMIPIGFIYLITLGIFFVGTVLISVLLT